MAACLACRPAAGMGQCLRCCMVSAAVRPMRCMPEPWLQFCSAVLARAMPPLLLRAWQEP